MANPFELVSSAIASSIVADMDPNAKLQAEMFDRYFDDKESRYERHMASGCSNCRNADSDQCRLADKLELIVDKWVNKATRK